MSSIQWFEVLEHSFPREVNGIDCVIETHGKSFSYKVINGEAVFVYVVGSQRVMRDFPNLSLLLSFARYDIHAALKATGTIRSTPIKEDLSS